MFYSQACYSNWQYKNAIVTDLYSLIDGPGIVRGVVDVIGREPRFPNFVLHRKFSSEIEAAEFCTRWMKASHDRSQRRVRP